MVDGARNIYQVYAERIARKVPIDAYGKRAISFARMHYLLACHCKIPREARSDFIRVLERRGLIVVENRCKIVFCVDLDE